MTMYQASYTPVVPGYDLVVTPWARIGYSWDHLNRTLIKKKDHTDVVYMCENVDGAGLNLNPVSTSNVLLHPAPGEDFNLFVNAADELMNKRETELVLEVRVREIRHANVLMSGYRYYISTKAVFFSI